MVHQLYSLLQGKVSCQLSKSFVCYHFKACTSLFIDLLGMHMCHQMTITNMVLYVYIYVCTA